MAKYRAHIAFVFIMSTYFLIRYLRSTISELPDFIRFHLTDLLFVPAMSLFALIVIRYIRKDRAIKIHWFAVLVQVVLVSIYFEWYLPNNSPEGHIHISDLIDCLMYAVGGVVFILAQPYVTNEGKKNGTR
ncbi:MAG: hypothetical protein P8P74_04610 [Crocinitomicaceae bacterium]|nr:hypothetical protein [Crocinitomicaceae bacterium]